jgi:4'-phosphopantetheinyl transferase
MEQSDDAVPSENDWLSANEGARLSTLRFPKRRADWRLGRWTAKLAASAFLNTGQSHLSLATIEIRPEASGAPQVFCRGRRAHVAISLTHRNAVAACAITRSSIVLGCDMERIEPRTKAFVADYFTQEEQALVARTPLADQLWLIPLLWSAKESALKAMQTGLRLDTRSVNVILLPSSQSRKGWSPLAVRSFDGTLFRGWWQRDDLYVRTAVSRSQIWPPIRLDKTGFIPRQKLAPAFSDS